MGMKSIVKKIIAQARGSRYEQRIIIRAGMDRVALAWDGVRAEWLSVRDMRWIYLCGLVSPWSKKTLARD